MGMFKFVGNAGKRLFGGGQIDERAVLDHLLSLGIPTRALSVVAHQDKKMISVIARVDTLEAKEKLLLAAGNISGIETVDDRVRILSDQKAEPDLSEADPVIDNGDFGEPAADEQPQSDFYTVESGDTLGAIARRFYGNAGKFPVIFEANRPMLSDPDKIYPGQVLRIPKLDG